MKLTPQSLVAIILASCILVITIGNVIYGYRNENIELATIWADLLKVMIGGLIGYIMSGNTK